MVAMDTLRRNRRRSWCQPGSAVGLYSEEQRSPIVQKLESRRLEKAVEVLDNHLKDRDYLLASGFSAADVNVGYSIHLGNQFLSFDAFPTAMQYYDRLRERPAFQASVPKKEG